MRNMPVCIRGVLFGKKKLTWFQQFDFLMQLLDSRASRMSPNQALISLHAEAITPTTASGTLLLSSISTIPSGKLKTLV